MAQEISLLIVDDDALLCETAADIFMERGYLVETALSGKEAVEKLQGRFFNVALLDIRLPDMEGTELLRLLKEMHPDTEGIIVTGHATLESSIKALREGAFAYVVKPLAMDEVIVAVDEALSKQRLRMARKEHLAWERRSKERYRALSMVDSLTELYNHRYFRELFAREIAQAGRYSYEVALLMIDIDNFKKYNDTYGHLAGDQALKLIARTLRRSTRASDIVARYGGEEFVIVMPHTSKQNAAIAAERLRGLIEKAQPEPWLTLSIGVASYPLDGKDDEQIISCADQALYEAKATKNRVCTFSSVTEEEAVAGGDDRGKRWA